MRSVAVVAVRNEIPYLANCLQHLIDNGIDYAIIDNDSDDGSAELLESGRFRAHLAAFETLPFTGAFDLTAQLEAKHRLYRRLDADWLIHLDADEVMHSYRPEERLDEALARIADEGADAVNFDEFVFLPVDHDYAPDCPGHQPLRRYYFFEPRKNRLIRAWRGDLRVDNTGSGGHELAGSEVRLARESLALRHFVFRDQDHAYRKYPTRAFAESDRSRGLHMNRVGVAAERFALPPAGLLEELEHPGDRNLRRDRPRKKHYWEWRGARPSLWRRWIGRRAKPGADGEKT